MTARDEPLEPPACPVCEDPTQVNRVMPERNGRWWCDRCALFVTGTTEEWVRSEVHRKHRAERAAESKDVDE